MGIFWMITENGRAFILTDSTPLETAEPYGDCLTHAGGHFEFWEALKAYGAAGIVHHGLPVAIAHREYEDFPRGRVVYRTTDAAFVINADRRLHGQGVVQHLPPGIWPFGIAVYRKARRALSQLTDRWRKR